MTSVKMRSSLLMTSIISTSNWNRSLIKRPSNFYSAITPTPITTIILVSLHPSNEPDLFLIEHSGNNIQKYCQSCGKVLQKTFNRFNECGTPYKP